MGEDALEIESGKGNRERKKGTKKSFDRAACCFEPTSQIYTCKFLVQAAKPNIFL